MRIYVLIWKQRGSRNADHRMQTFNGPIRTTGDPAEQADEYNAALAALQSDKHTKIVYAAIVEQEA